MKTRMIKSLFTIACLLCSIQMFAAIIEVSCDYDFKVDGICYSYAPNEELACLVTYNDYRVGSTSGSYNIKTKYEGTIVIPEEVTYGNKVYKVVGIKDYAFCFYEELTNVVIPNSVVAIGEESFCGCI